VTHAVLRASVIAECKLNLVSIEYHVKLDDITVYNEQLCVW
jgi:hypothetical protein